MNPSWVKYYLSNLRAWYQKPPLIESSNGTWTPTSKHTIIQINPDIKESSWTYSPAHVIPDLMEVLPTEYKDNLGEIWDNACGNGALVNELKKLGYSVFGSDAAHRLSEGYAEINFLYDDVSEYQFDTIITHPSYSLIDRWVTQSLEHADLVIILTKFQFLRGIRRAERFKTGQWPLACVFPFVRQITLQEFNSHTSWKLSRRSQTYAWFVLDNNHTGRSIHMDWII